MKREAPAPPTKQELVMAAMEKYRQRSLQLEREKLSELEHKRRVETGQRTAKRHRRYK